MTSTRFTVSVAVDIGGSSTGYAVKMFDRTKTDILYPEWTPQEERKTKSCILFDPNKTFVAFGHDAEIKMEELVKKGKEKAWFFFDNFKRVLINNCNKDTTFVTSSRKSMHASDVFEALFIFLRNHVIKTCQRHQISVESSQIAWGIAIPSGTENSSGKLLCQCAEKVGFSRNQFHVIPDTLSIAEYMKAAYYPYYKEVFDEGETFEVCDTGGLSIDIGGYSVKEDDELEQVYILHDVQYGSDTVNTAFLNRLTDFLGANVIQAFRTYHSTHVREMFQLLHTDMKYMTSEMEKSLAVALRIPTKLTDVFRMFNPTSPTTGTIYPSEKFYGSVEMTDNTLTIATKLILPIFKFTIDGVVSVLKKAMSSKKMKNVSHLFLTGGFSEFPLFQDILEDNFPDLNFYFVENPRDIVMLGVLVVMNNIETKESLKNLPPEISSLPLDQQLVFCEAVQRNPQRTNHIKVAVLAHAGINISEVLRNLGGVKEIGGWRGHKNGFFTSYIGRCQTLRKGERPRAYAIPAAADWRERQINVASVGVTTESNAVGSEDLIILSEHRKSPSQNSSKENSEHIKLPKIVDHSRNEENNPSLKHSKRRESSMTNKEIVQNQLTKRNFSKNKARLNKTNSGHSNSRNSVLSLIDLNTDESELKRSKSSSPAFKPSYSHPKLDEESLVPCTFHFVHGETSLYGGFKDLYQAAIVLVVFSLDINVTDDVSESEMFEGNGSTLPLMKYLTKWIQFTHALGSQRSEEVPVIVPFGVYSKNETSIIQGRYDMLMKGVLQRCKKYLTVANLLREQFFMAHVKNANDDGYERVRNLILEIHNDNKKFSQSWIPTPWMYMESLLDRKRAEGVKIMSKQELTELAEVTEFEKLSEIELDIFLKYQHSLGKLVNGPQLSKDGVVLNVSWPLLKMVNIIAKENKRKSRGINKTKNYEEDGFIKPNTMTKYMIELSRKKDPDVTALILRIFEDMDVLLKRKVFNEAGEIVFDSERVIASLFPAKHLGGIVEKLLRERKAKALRYNFSSQSIQATVFHRLLAVITSIWQIAKNEDQILLTRTFGAFLIDNMHRLILMMDGDFIVLLLCNRTGNVNINPAVCRNVQNTITQNLSRILCLPNDHTVNEFFIIEVATCNTTAPCYKPLSYFQNTKSWVCNFHRIKGRSEDLLNVWFSEKKSLKQVHQKESCTSDCQGLSEDDLKILPSEKIVGRLVRRLRPEITQKIGLQLGLDNSIIRGIEREHKTDIWMVGFNLICHAVMSLDKTMKNLQRVLVTYDLDSHLLCEVSNLQKDIDLHAPDNVSDRVITTQELLAISDNISHDAFPLAIELGITTEAINMIRDVIPKREQSLFLRHLLLKWKENSKKPTFRHLLSALNEVQLDSECILNSMDVHSYDQLF